MPRGDDMNINDLKKYECPELTVIEKFDHGDQHERLQWSRLLTKEMHEFRIDFTDQRLKNNEIVIPIFIDDILLPLSYTSYSEAKPITYNTYSNYVFFEIEYKRAHLLKVIHNFGIRTFNPNDEKYLKPIILDTVEYYFQFDFDKQLWKWSQHEKNIDVWNKEKEMLDQLFESDQALETTKNYYAIRKQFQSLHLEDFKTYSELFGFFIDLLNCTKSFIELRKAIGDLSSFAFDKMILALNELQKSLDSIQTDAEGEQLNLYIQTSTEIAEYQINNRISRLHVSTKDKLFNPGYWIIGQNVYPNIAEYYNLSQKASTNRTAETKYALKQELIKRADGHDIFIALSSVDIKKTGG